MTCECRCVELKGDPLLLLSFLWFMEGGVAVDRIRLYLCTLPPGELCDGEPSMYLRNRCGHYHYSK